LVGGGKKKEKRSPAGERTRKVGSVCESWGVGETEEKKRVLHKTQSMMKR